MFSALAPTTDFAQYGRHVRSVPEANFRCARRHAKARPLELKSTFDGSVTLTCTHGALDQLGRMLRQFALYGVDPGLIFSFPSRTDGGVSRIVEGLAHDEFSTRKLHATLEELRKERDAVKELGLVPA